MKIEHIALWTNQLEKMKKFYVNWFSGTASNKYLNDKTGFKSYFIDFMSGSRLEIMQKQDIPENSNDTVHKQHIGLIHIAFGVDTMEEVDSMAIKMKSAGLRVLRGPRKTGDGYYEFETLDPDNNRLEITSVFR
ncbi:VOC family protein [Eudoraea chungangensis]|uniref:VOC family protein n=1 Tax=Eudoraea chungangensis TaxID=1481905 RepID=UPI0023ED08E3|nr:VOC family protein [Eudoraea chungangensis]